MAIKKDTRETTEARSAPAEDLETAVRAVVEPYRNWTHKAEASRILAELAELVERDETWLYEGGPPALPVVTLLQPSSAIVGDIDDITLEVIGTGFQPHSVIFFNAGQETTTFVDDTKLTTIVKPSTATTAGPVPVEVHTNEMVSNSMDFSFADPAARGANKKKG